MLFVGIDIAKNKHDCCIIDSDSVIITDSLRISNTKEDFDILYNTILSTLDSNDLSKVKIGLHVKNIVTKKQFNYVNLQLALLVHPTDR